MGNAYSYPIRRVRLGVGKVTVKLGYNIMKGTEYFVSL
jgi:hypothetical protein